MCQYRGHHAHARTGGVKLTTAAATVPILVTMPEALHICKGYVLLKAKVSRMGILVLTIEYAQGARLMHRSTCYYVLKYCSTAPDTQAYRIILQSHTRHRCMQTLLPLCCKSPRLCTRALAHDSSLCLVASQLYYQQCHDASAWPYSCENSAYAMVSPELNAFPAHVLACTVCVLYYIASF